MTDSGSPVAHTPSNTLQDKMAFVGELLRGDPALTMNQAGKHVRARFGAQLSYHRLREAYLAAGGQVDTRRGRGRGRGRPKGSGRKAAGRKPGRPRGRRGGRSRENTLAKQALIAELVRGSPDMTMNEAGKRVRAKFGTQLAFPRLKEAFRAAGGKVGRPGRRPKPRPHVAERKAGRRASDVRAARARATLGGMPQHVVIVHNGGDIVPHEFGTRDQAESFTQGQLQRGVALTSIGYYMRQPLKINVGV